MRRSGLGVTHTSEEPIKQATTLSTGRRTSHSDGGFSFVPWIASLCCRRWTGVDRRCKAVPYSPLLLLRKRAVPAHPVSLECSDLRAARLFCLYLRRAENRPVCRSEWVTCGPAQAASHSSRASQRWARLVVVCPSALRNPPPGHWQEWYEGCYRRPSGPHRLPAASGRREHRWMSNRGMSMSWWTCSCCC